MADSVILRDEDVRRIGEYVKPWLRELMHQMSPRNDPDNVSTHLLDRMTRVEEELKGFGAALRSQGEDLKTFGEALRSQGGGAQVSARTDPGTTGADGRALRLYEGTIRAGRQAVHDADLDDRRGFRGHHVADDGVRVTCLNGR